MKEAGLVGECASSVSKGNVITYVQEKVPPSINSGLTTTSTTMGNDYYVLGVPVNGFNFGGPTSFSSSAPSSSGSSVTATSTGTSLPSPTKAQQRVMAVCRRVQKLGLESPLLLRVSPLSFSHFYYSSI
jgi:hypothetical protein